MNISIEPKTVGSAHFILFIIVLIILGFLIWQNHWKIQLMYNSSSVSAYTPDTFPVAHHLKESYETTTEEGFETMKQKTIVICALVRDVENKMAAIERKAEKIGKSFYNYRILIVENDSSDKTRELLLNWAKRNPKVEILGCGLNAEKCSIKGAEKKTEGHSVYRTRIEKMVYLRNIYLEWVQYYAKTKSPSPVKGITTKHFDYMAVWDLDTIGNVYIDGIANTIQQFKNNPDADAICAYGIYRFGPLEIYYDTYAHLTAADKFHIDSKTYHDVKTRFNVQHKRGEDMVPVVSCFSGFTMYRVSSLMKPGVEYDMSPPENLECEHVRLHSKLSGKIFLNPSMINLVLLND